MSKKENFNQAMFDMFGVGSDKKSGENPVKPSPETAVKVIPPEAELVTTTKASAPSTHTDSGAAPYVLVPATYLAPGTIMEGVLKSKGDVDVAGSFKGDIVSEGDVTLRYSFEGNVTANNLTILDCNMMGDSHVTNRLQLSQSSVITGNVTTNELMCAGTIHGDSTVYGNATFESSARVDGNISTDTMTMEKGAVISGGLTMGAAKKK